MNTRGMWIGVMALAGILSGAVAVQAQDFDGCGELADGGNCVLFRAFGSDNYYVLDDYGDFQVWDMVRVTGTLDPDCVTQCDFYTGCILDNTISDQCEIDFDDCGWLIQGVECVLFDSDNYGLYELDDYGVYGVGDRVHVTGIRDPYCISWCMQGDGCITANTISDQGTPTDTESWGRVKALYR